MVNTVNPTDGGAAFLYTQMQNPRLLPRDMSTPKSGDTVSFGQGEEITADQAQGIVYERAMEKLRSVVADARAQLGISEDTVLDTSPEATANRIADFALGFFGKYAENNGLEDNEAGRKQYAEFIGKAVNQGISEARGILTALNALNGTVDNNINATSDTIQKRFDDFIKNGAKQSADTLQNTIA